MDRFKAKILGVGSYLPPKVVTNFDLENMLDTSDEWIRQRTGIIKRHWVDDEMCTSDLAYWASIDAIQAAGISKNDIDMIIFASLSPDHDFPGTGCFLQKKLEISEIPALDIRQQCTGFLYGLSIANEFIASGNYKNILLVGAEVHSKALDKTPRGRNVSVLFGDGAGACIISRSEVDNSKTDSHLISFKLHADGSYAKELWVPAPGSAVGGVGRIDTKILDEGLHYPMMNGKVVFTHAVKKMAETLTQNIEENGYKLSDVDCFLFHQANLRINYKVAEVLGIDQGKVFNTIQKYGNTTAATIPIGMFDAISAGVLKPSMLVASAAFGSGFTWASGIWRQ